MQIQGTAFQNLRERALVSGVGKSQLFSTAHKPMPISSNIDIGGLYKFGMTNPISDRLSTFVPHYELKFFGMAIIDPFQRLCDCDRMC